MSGEFAGTLRERVVIERPVSMRNAMGLQEPGWEELCRCDDAALAEDANLVVLGGEVFQFGAVEPLGQGVFRLSRLMRGRWGTEAAVGTHAADETFVLLERDALRAVDLPQWTIGTNVKASARNVSGSISESPTITVAGPPRDVIASPDGGTTVDGEARASIDQILQAMRQHGLIAS
jgi:hypothetical protein